MKDLQKMTGGLIIDVKGDKLDMVQANLIINGCDNGLEDVYINGEVTFRFHHRGKSKYDLTIYGKMFRYEAIVEKLHLDKSEIFGNFIRINDIRLLIK